jgi:hypothetical protein
MQIRVSWNNAAIWLIVSLIAVLSCALSKPSAHLGAEYFPIGNDSFYHARRILDAAADPGAFYEFDTKIHAPEGSLLVWPWGYDFVMAKLVRAGTALGLSGDPLQILLRIPVAAVVLGMALLMLLARRLQLNSWLTTLAALCMALSPTTQLLFGFGEVDHHFAEFLYVLACAAVGLAWFQRPTVLKGALLGAIFGTSLAVHNGLFVLQLPLLITMAVHWWSGQTISRQPALALIVALVTCALAVLIPSLPFRLGRFEFYTLSWFHLYVVVCTALFIGLMAWTTTTRNRVVGLAVLAIALLLPLLNAIGLAHAFLAGSPELLKNIQEMQSPLRLALSDGASFVTRFYSFLIWLAPVTFILCAVQCWRERQRPRLFFWVSAVAGLTLLALQLRLHYFGGFALYLPWLVLIQDYIARHPQAQRRTLLVVTLLLLLAFVPQIRYTLIAPIPRAGDASFEQIHPLLLVLREACAKNPGVVLADNNAGHHIRYYTECSVIANNFLLTEQQFAKAAEARQLFAAPADELTRRAPYVKYVLVRAARITSKGNGEFTYAFFGGDTDPQGARTLLLGAAHQIPASFQLIDGVDLLASEGSTRSVPYARLYRVEAASLSEASSLNHVSN